MCWNGKCIILQATDFCYTLTCIIVNYNKLTLNKIWLTNRAIWCSVLVQKVIHGNTLKHYQTEM